MAACLACGVLPVAAQSDCPDAACRPCDVPCQPDCLYGLTAAPATDGGVQVKWQSVPQADAFHVERRLARGDWDIVGDAPAVQTSLHDDEVALAQDYEYRVTAVAADGTPTGTFCPTTVHTAGSWVEEPSLPASWLILLGGVAATAFVALAVKSNKR